MINKKSACIAGVVLVGMTFFLLHHLFSFSPIRIVHQISASVLYPFLHLQRIFVEPVKKWSQRNANKQELYATIDALQTQKDTLSAENIRLQATLAHYKDIRELVQFNKRYADTGHVAQVLLKHFSSREHFFLVDGGSDQGITKDMVAIYKNNLLGRVVEVYPWYSKIQLITDASCQVAAYCTRTRAQGIHKGTYNEHQSMLDYVSHLEHLQVGDLVVSSGEGMIFPQGFALGTIVSYVTGDLYQQVTVKPIIDFRSINYCMVLAKK